MSRSDADRPATGRRAAVENSVLRATEELLELGHPFSELKIEQIASRAGISRTTFYFYFKDKRELLLSLSAGAAAGFLEIAERWWSTGGEAGLERAVTEVVEQFAKHALLVGAVVDASAYDDQVAAWWRALVGRFVESTQVRLEAEREAGAGGPSLAAAGSAFVLCWMTERACYQVFAQREGPSREELERALMAVWRGAVYGR